MRFLLGLLLAAVTFVAACSAPEVAGDAVDSGSGPVPATSDAALDAAGDVRPEGSAADPAPTSASPGSASADRAVVASPSPRPAPDEPAPASMPRAPSLPAVAVVRSVGPMPDDLGGRLREADAARHVVPVGSAPVLLHGSRDATGQVVDAPPAGWGIPVNVVSVDPAAYGRLLPPASRRAFAQLRPGRALLGATSARVRGLGAGATLDLEGLEVRVAGVVPDGVVGGAEVVVSPADGERIGAAGVRYILVGGPGSPRVLRRDVEADLSGHERVLARGLGRAPWRTWREVLPQAVVKDRFGEFAIRPGAGRDMDQEPGWAKRHIVTGAVPILGEVSCHRAMLPALRRAMAALQRRGLEHLVDPGDYAGCFSPRLIGPGAGVSRHAWGLAVDLNASRNAFGTEGAQDPRLVEVMEAHGFGYGGRWPVPDPMHFEYRGPHSWEGWRSPTSSRPRSPRADESGFCGTVRLRSCGTAHPRR